MIKQYETVDILNFESIRYHRFIDEARSTSREFIRIDRLKSLS